MRRCRSYFSRVPSASWRPCARVDPRRDPVGRVVAPELQAELRVDPVAPGEVGLGLVQPLPRAVFVANVYGAYEYLVAPGVAR